MRTIAIDCGASFIKGAAFDDGVLIQGVNKSAPTVHNEQSIFAPCQIMPLVQMVEKMIAELAHGEKEITLCISNEMHGFLLAHEDGRPYTDYISWQKEYGAIPIEGKSCCELLECNEALRETITRTGMPLRAGLPSSNLYYLLRSGQIQRYTEKLQFYTLGSYLLKALSHGLEPLEHPTNAAATGLYDLMSGDWNRTYIKAIGAENIAFPRIGQESIEFVLNGINVHALPAIGDQQAALLGADFTGDTELSFNLGTGAQVSCLTDKPVVCLKAGQIRPYFGGKYLKTIPHIPSGRALNVYFRFVKSVLAQYGVHADDDTVWKGMIDAAAEANPQSELKVDLSFFENALSPATHGSIERIAEYGLTMGNLLRAVFEQMAENFIDLANRLQPDASYVTKLVFSGGIARRFSVIRERIACQYPHASITVASDETMIGLFKYSQMCKERI